MESLKSNIYYTNDMCLSVTTSKENDIEFCFECGCEYFEKKDIKYEEIYESEYELYCKKCGNLVNEYSYGFFRNEKNERYKIEENRRLRNKKLKRMMS